MNYAERDKTIVTRYKAGATQEALAAEFDVSRPRIAQILSKAGVSVKDTTRASRELYGFIGINVTEAVKARCVAEAKKRNESLSKFVGDIILKHLTGFLPRRSVYRKPRRTA